MSQRWTKLIFGGSLLLLVAAFGKPEPTPDPSPEAILALYPKDYFVSPVDDAIKLTGTFGELRPDHFHSGIDIKSKTGGVGQPIFAAAEGFVDRIKVQASGYGNVMYVKHPNGYTTVYAHLDRFAPEIEQFVKEQQYKKESFEVDLQPKDGQFKVRQGQTIGNMGNSGGSTGPHLHFEIRNSATQKGLNPLLFGLPVPDKEAPYIQGLRAYFLSEKREVNLSRDLKIVRKGPGQYGVENDTLQLGAWRIGFGLKAFDQMSGFRNENGIFALSMMIDDQLAYEWRMAELDLEETRYLNAHVDYPAKRKGRGWFQRCFILPGDKLSNYTRTEGMGVVPLYLEKASKVKMKVLDTGGNTSTLEFWVKRSPNMESYVGQPYQYEFRYDTDNKIETADLQLSIPEGVLYETIPFQYRTTQDASSGIYSPVHHLHNTQTPVHRYFDIALRPYAIPEHLKDKAVVAHCGAGRPDNCGGTWKGDMLAAKARHFGDFCVMIDTIPPKIMPVVFDDDMRRKNSMSFRISDNFDASGAAKGLYFRGTVDGKWVLFEYDKKRDRLTHVFDGRIGAGEHSLRLTVCDDRNNEAVYEGRFVR